MTPKRKVPSLPALNKRLKEFTEAITSTGLPGSPVIGRARERLIGFILWFLEDPGELKPAFGEVDDGSMADAQYFYDGFREERRKAVQTMLVPYIGAVLDRDKTRRLGITVCGRYDLLKENKQIDGWHGDEIVETLLFVHETQRIAARGRQYYIEVEAYYGEPAGIRWVSRMSGGRIQMLIRESGVAVRRKYRDEDFAGMWLVATIQYINNQLVFHEVSADYSHEKYNRALMKRRQEICKGPCLYMNGKTCAPCPVSRTQCPRSRYRTAFSIEGQCKNNHLGLKQAAEDEYCFSCLIRGKFQYEEHYKARSR
jgi:hypothetical protein